jgi:hypothetical protein
MIMVYRYICLPLWEAVMREFGTRFSGNPARPTPQRLASNVPTPMPAITPRTNNTSSINLTEIVRCFVPSS